ncbi:MAG TPA: hypothetical protein VJ483_02350, partial [Holophagaceae bacterium]|nr:hypothetical protein [Holophagaceae bacterium]
AMRKANHPNAKEAADLADLFCRNTERRIRAKFAGFGSNDDNLKVKVSRAVLDGQHKWMETGLTRTEAMAMLDKD